MKNTICKAFMLLGLTGFLGCGSGGGTVLSPAEFNSRINATTQVQLVDVRTPGEYAEGHLPGAVNIDYKADDFSEKAEVLATGMDVYVYCRSGKRSAASAKILTKMGYSVIDLDGGYLGWVESGLPTEE